jgi:hypothetical protein
MFDHWWALGERMKARDALCCLVHTEIAYLGFMRSGEQVSLQREDVATMICGPTKAKRLGVRPFVVLPLLGPTKSSTNEAAGIVICWVTKSGIRVGEHVTSQ